MKAIEKRKWRKRNAAIAGIFKSQGDDFSGHSFANVIADTLDQSVLIILTAGGGCNAVTGVVGAVHRDHLTLVNGNIITSVPYDRIAAVSRFAGGGPVPPLCER